MQVYFLIVSGRVSIPVLLLPRKQLSFEVMTGDAAL